MDTSKITELTLKDYYKNGDGYDPIPISDLKDCLYEGMATLIELHNQDHLTIKEFSNIANVFDIFHDLIRNTERKAWEEEQKADNAATTARLKAVNMQ